MRRPSSERTERDQGEECVLSTCYNIYSFSKPKKRELKDIGYFAPYDAFEVTDTEGEETGEYIRLYRWDDEYAANIRESRFAVELTLPEKETDFDSLYRSLGYSEDAITHHKVHIAASTGWRCDISDGEKQTSIMYDDFDKFEIIVQTHCFAVKMRKLWDSDEVYCYIDSERVVRYLPDIDKFTYVPVSNQILAKAEIPFLIFERYRGRCFIEKS